jgi:hypothetical protein
MAAAAEGKGVISGVVCRFVFCAFHSYCTSTSSCNLIVKWFGAQLGRCLHCRNTRKMAAQGQVQAKGKKDRQVIKPQL